MCKGKDAVCEYIDVHVDVDVTSSMPHYGDETNTELHCMHYRVPVTPSSLGTRVMLSSDVPRLKLRGGTVAASVHVVELHSDHRSRTATTPAWQPAMAASPEKVQCTRQVYLWLMASTYLFAFVSLYTQIPGKCCLIILARIGYCNQYAYTPYG